MRNCALTRTFVWPCLMLTNIVKAARLQSEFGTKLFVLSYEFSYEKRSETFPEIVEPLYQKRTKRTIRAMSGNFP